MVKRFYMDNKFSSFKGDTDVYLVRMRSQKRNIKKESKLSKEDLKSRSNSTLNNFQRKKLVVGV